MMKNRSVNGPICAILVFFYCYFDFGLQTLINNLVNRVMEGDNLILKNPEPILANDVLFREHGIVIPFPQHDVHIRPEAAG